MLNIHSFTFNPFQENTYLLTNEHQQCWVIDPGMYYPDEQQQLEDYITQHQLSPQAIINTHAHIDHILGLPYLKGKYNLPFYLHQQELAVLQSARGSAAMFGFTYDNPPMPDTYMTEGTTLKLGDDELKVLFTPGHSPGSVSLYYEKGGWVLAGDALFAGSIGRTDLPGGNTETLIKSIKTQLLSLPGDTVVYSGHGPSTTIRQEQKTNPFLQ